MIDLFEEYGYDYFEDYSLIKEVEGYVSENSCPCDSSYTCREHLQQ
jgi:hypothetical protein